jgi:hypothetical protein
MKVQVRNLTRNEGVMLSTLFGCGGMRHGNHHLYDELDADADADGKPGGKEEGGLRDEDFD